MDGVNTNNMVVYEAFNVGVCYRGYHQQYGGAMGYNCGSIRKI
jgi:hypothetical protein